MKKHKANYDRKYEDKYFGSYYVRTTPVCDSVYPWNGKSYIQVKRWKDVTCKRCLKSKPKGD